MSDSSKELETRVRQYLDNVSDQDARATTESLLGYGQDGSVWATSRRSAVKAFRNPATYNRELSCYQRLKNKDISALNGFPIPRLVAFDGGLFVIEMEIVEAPFLLDFGKAHLDHCPYTQKDLEEWIKEYEELWGEKHWKIVWALVRKLRAQGIYYMDPNPRNIRFVNWQSEEL
jgi:hypothetical protein